MTIRMDRPPIQMVYPNGWNRARRKNRGCKQSSDSKSASFFEISRNTVSWLSELAWLDQFFRQAAERAPIRSDRFQKWFARKQFRAVLLTPFFSSASILRQFLLRSGSSPALLSLVERLGKRGGQMKIQSSIRMQLVGLGFAAALLLASAAQAQ